MSHASSQFIHASGAPAAPPPPPMPGRQRGRAPGAVLPGLLLPAPLPLAAAPAGFAGAPGRPPHALAPRRGDSGLRLH